ncbi:DUF4249 domain-containing protein [Mucilaginibacter corticis]|nr:DUF4249 domain-containing protein [Mucilaginibacter corticis]
MIAAAILIIGCKKPYNPSLAKYKTGELVVEGFINPGNDTTRFKLNRIVRLDTAVTAPVNNAQVIVEGADNSTYKLEGDTKGNYTAVLSLNNSQKYRLHIITTDNKNYVSDYVEVKITPVIDALNYSIKNNGLQINLDTHDAANTTRYYRWDYIETWEFHSKYESTYYVINNDIQPRPLDKQIYYCYSSANSANVLLGSSAKLTQDVIAQAPVAFVPSSSEKIEVEYSVIVYQYALTSDAFNFWQNLKKNTEQLGSIFDAQPSEITGNIHCTTDPTENVVGYISASTVQSKRIFVKNEMLPQSWKATYPYDCEADSIFEDITIGGKSVNQVDQQIKGSGVFLPITKINSLSHGQGYLASSPICVDCTLRGTIIKPSFWQ